MKLEYYVLWFEDDADWADAAREHIEDWLSDQGFRLNLELIENRVTGDDQFLDRVPEDELDLILVDLNLAEQTGDEVIKIIRSTYRHTEIVFYSADGAPKVRKAAAAAGVDGVYCSGRQDFSEEAIAVIGTTIKKVMDINTMRGLMMAATAQLDNLLQECIELSVRNDSGDDQEIVDDIAAKLLRDVKRNTKHAERDLTPGQPLASILGNLHFGSYKRVTRLAALTKRRPDLKEERESLLEYEKLLSMRNILAHAVEKRRQDGTKVLAGWRGKEDQEFDGDYFRRVRRDLIKREADLKEMRRKLEITS